MAEFYRIFYTENGVRRVYFNNTSFTFQGAQNEIRKLKKEFPLRENYTIEKIRLRNKN